MKKKTNKQTNKVTFYLAIGSFIITLVEGLLYYTELFPNPLFRWMMIIQNSIKAFGFSPNISIHMVADILKESTDKFEIFIGYVYTISIFVAPYCTVAYIYKVVERFLRIKYWKWWFLSDKTRCLIFGYNDEVKALLDKYDKKKYRIHIVSPDITDEQGVELLREGIIAHNVDLLKSPDDAAYFLKQMELKITKNIVLFENSSAKNFSLYKLFHNEKLQTDTKMNTNMKFYCRCEDAGIQSILEDYHDANVKRCMDIEVVSLPELRVRQMISNNRLHQYYLKNRNKLNSHDEAKNWDLHMLIVGFGKLGQQLLLQTMNQGVISSSNKIVIDVVDFNIDEKKSMFSNNFNDDYVVIEDNAIKILSDKADGELIIRFHKMDIRFHEFKKFLTTYGNEANMFTFVAICLKNTDISLHCLTQVQRYLMKHGKMDDVCVAIRMEFDKNMARYLNVENNKYKNVYVIEDAKSTISLKELLHDEVNKDARTFNLIYNRCNLLTDETYEANKKAAEERAKQVANGIKAEEEEKSLDNEQEAWNKLELVYRNSNRALAYHEDVKKLYMSEENFKEYFGPNGLFLRDRGEVWTCKSANEVAKLQNMKEKYPLVHELSKLEHRRWCYYMASCGWKRTDNPKANKIVELKENPCMCPWDELMVNKADTAMYDLMPLILKYKKDRTQKS